ncbi:MAG: hypothetical protein LBQ02_00705 [Candidatus Nomurabacteria bacterium]|jgi:hypothetical protein|nr:hypothetical protein [Candidatus Nomurabacteria bacterium]
MAKTTRTTGTTKRPKSGRDFEKLLQEITAKDDPQFEDIIASAYTPQFKEENKDDTLLQKFLDEALLKKAQTFQHYRIAHNHTLFCDDNKAAALREMMERAEQFSDLLETLPCTITLEDAHFVLGKIMEAVNDNGYLGLEAYRTIKQRFKPAVTFFENDVLKTPSYHAKQPEDNESNSFSMAEYRELLPTLRLLVSKIGQLDFETAGSDDHLSYGDIIDSDWLGAFAWTKFAMSGKCTFKGYAYACRYMPPMLAYGQYDSQCVRAKIVKDMHAKAKTEDDLGELIKASNMILGAGIPLDLKRKIIKDVLEDRVQSIDVLLEAYALSINIPIDEESVAETKAISDKIGKRWLKLQTSELLKIFRYATRFHFERSSLDYADAIYQAIHQANFGDFSQIYVEIRNASEGSYITTEEAEKFLKALFEKIESTTKEAFDECLSIHGMVDYNHENSPQAPGMKELSHATLQRISELGEMFSAQLGKLESGDGGSD